MEVVNKLCSQQQNWKKYRLEDKFETMNNCQANQHWYETRISHCYCYMEKFVGKMKQMSEKKYIRDGT